MKSSTLVRHLSAIALLILAWNRLNLWYEFLHPVVYTQFAACFGLGIVLAAYREIGPLLNGVSTARKLVAAAILLLSLPWSEWFQLALPMAREDWSMQLFTQSCCVYGAILLLSLQPQVPESLKKTALSAVDRVAAGRVAMFLIPALFFVFTSGITLFVFHRTTLIQDAAAHLFQAKIFAAGHLYAPAPPFSEAFSYEGDMLVLQNGKWFSIYLPGFSMMLAAAMKIRCEWFLGPALGAATIGIWIAYAFRWHNRRVALILGCLALFSPIFFLMYASVMVHTAELFFTSAVVYFCRRETEEPSGRRLALLALCLFCGVITRGFSFLPFLLPLILFTLWKRLGKGAMKAAAAIAAAVLCAVVFIAWYQWNTTGDPMVSGYSLEYRQPLYYGFGGEMLGQRHTPLRGLENVSNSLLGMNQWLTGWPTGTLFFLLLFVLRAKRPDSWDLALCAGCAAIAILYYFYVIQDLLIGPRFWFLMVPVSLLFLSRSIVIEDLRLRPYAASLAVLSFAVYLFSALPGYITLFAPAKNQAGQLRAEMMRHRAGKTLVMLDRHVAQHFVNWNDPFLREGLVLCKDMGEKNPALKNAYSDYEFAYFRESQSVQKSSVQAGYRILDTPDPDPPGYLSLFTFALMIHASNSYVREDLFDLSYAGILQGDSAADQMAYIEQLQEQTPAGEPDVRRDLRSGLIHAARMLLLPKQALEQRKKEWPRALDTVAFRSELDSAMQQFVRAGDTGVPLVQQLTKIQQRIDVNEDGQMSDQEVVKFLSLKLRMLELHGG